MTADRIPAPIMWCTAFVLGVVCFAEMIVIAIIRRIK